MKQTKRGGGGPQKNVIMLQQLRVPDEVRALDKVPVGAAESKEKELKLVVQLISHQVQYSLWIAGP